MLAGAPLCVLSAISPFAGLSSYRKYSNVSPLERVESFIAQPGAHPLILRLVHSAGANSTVRAATAWGGSSISI